MKIVAPLVLTLGLSFILYRETGKWNPVEVWPKLNYDILHDPKTRAEVKMRRDAPMSGYHEGAYKDMRHNQQADLDQAFRRGAQNTADWTESSYSQFKEEYPGVGGTKTAPAPASGR